MKASRVLRLLHQGDGLTFGGRALLRIPATWEAYDRVVSPMGLKHAGPFVSVTWQRGCIELTVRLHAECPWLDEKWARAVRRVLCQLRRRGITERVRVVQRAAGPEPRSTRDTTTKHPLSRAIEDSGVHLDPREMSLLWGFVALPRLPVWFPFPGPARAQRRERRAALSLYRGARVFLRELGGA